MAMIKVDLKRDGTITEMDESLLEKREETVDNDNETAVSVEYWLNGELVHRSCHMTLKKWPEGMGAIAAQFGQ